MAFYYLPLLFVFFLFSMCIFVAALHCSALLCVYWISLLTRLLPCFLCPFAILSLLFPFSVSPLPVRYFWQLLCVCLKAWKAIVATVGILSIVCVCVCVSMCVSVQQTMINTYALCQLDAKRLSFCSSCGDWLPPSSSPLLLLLLLLFFSAAAAFFFSFFKIY